MVGDVSPARVLDQVEKALGAWTGYAEGVARRRRCRRPTPGRCSSSTVPVRCSRRCGWARRRCDATTSGYPALQLANLIFGGYFSSRWTANIREDKGYTYGPHSRIDHHQLGSTLMFDVEVASEVTAPALLETLYELGRIASLPVTDGEVDAVRQYAIGNLAMSTATQAGLASTLSALAAQGSGRTGSARTPRGWPRPNSTTVSAAAAEFFAPGPADRR